MRDVSLVINYYPKINFFIETNLRSLSIICDEEKIAQVLINLFDNAAKYCSAGVVKITIEKAFLNEEQAVCLSVCDSGIGIPENQIAQIFGPFIQSAYTKKMSGGKGLGLSICEKLISLHHGKIGAKNNVNQPGATFYFIIPVGC